MFNERWDRHFLGLALAHAKMSKDPDTRVGAVLVGPRKNIVSAGFNGFPRKVRDTIERLQDKEMKLRLVVHAEINAVLLSPVRPVGCTLYLAATDDSGKVWGGPPCTRCMVELLQCELFGIVSHQVKDHEPSRWHADIAFSRVLMDEACMPYREWRA